LDLLMRYMTECQAMMQPAMGAGEMQIPPEAMAAGMPPGMPPGMPMGGAPSIGDVNINPSINLPPPTPGGMM
jgi:hypothetical protein